MNRACGAWAAQAWPEAPEWVPAWKAILRLVPETALAWPAAWLPGWTVVAAGVILPPEQAIVAPQAILPPQREAVAPQVIWPLERAIVAPVILPVELGLERLRPVARILRAVRILEVGQPAPVSAAVPVVRPAWLAPPAWDDPQCAAEWECWSLISVLLQ